MKNALASLALITVVAVPVMPQEGDYHDPGLKKLTQVAIVCRDIDASAKRWAGFLGVPLPKITTTKPGSEVKMTYRGRPSNGQVKLAFINLGQVTLELLQPVGGDSSWKELLDANGESVHHIAFEVNDVPKTVAAAGKQGFPMIHQGRYDNDKGSYTYVDSRKDLGVVIEFLHSEEK